MASAASLASVSTRASTHHQSSGGSVGRVGVASPGFSKDDAVQVVSTNSKNNLGLEGHVLTIKEEMVLFESDSGRQFWIKASGLQKVNTR